jgi:hypothetical protein
MKKIPDVDNYFGIDFWAIQCINIEFRNFLIATLGYLLIKFLKL